MLDLLIKISGNGDVGGVVIALKSGIAFCKKVLTLLNCSFVIIEYFTP